MKKTLQNIPFLRINYLDDYLIDWEEDTGKGRWLYRPKIMAEKLQKNYEERLRKYIEDSEE